MSTKLNKIATKARSNPKIQFTSLAHIITPEFLFEIWKTMNKNGAGGVDGISMKEFENGLAERLIKICEKLKSNKYKAPPVRRVEIPKGGKSNKTRPLGIPTIEDRLLQKAVARILDSIYEQDFMNCSYGFRINRNPHKALSQLRSYIISKNVMQIYEADIRGYFNNINHDWLGKMIRLRIADPVILKLIGKWLKAGVMINGVVHINDKGMPQGGPISCILSNVYLHYVLDLWFEKKVRPCLRGEANLVRFVDDFVIGFQYKEDVLQFKTLIEERMRKFSLELVPEKTKIISFGRFARERELKYGVEAGTFDFLGFKHVCGKDKNGKFSLIRIPSQKSCRKFLDKVDDWLKKRNHWKRREQQRHLSAMLSGFYQYFSLVNCHRKLRLIFHEVQLKWIRTLRRRSQRHRMHWSFLSTREWFKLPQPPSGAIHGYV